MSEELTPMQRQYRAIKRELPPGAILMFRLGDFYEMFGPGASAVKNLPACQYRRHGVDPWVRKIPLEKGMATHSSILAWSIPWTEQPGGLPSVGSQRVGQG